MVRSALCGFVSGGGGSLDMPRVVPSQVVSVIDQMFPLAATAGQQTLWGGHSAAVSALLELVDQVPAELIVLNAQQYATLVLSRGVLRNALTIWQSGRDGWAVTEVPGIANLHPISAVRQALTQCPDDIPAPGTAELAFIGDQALRESIRLDISAANKNLSEGEWKAATVLAGSAVEALLLWALENQEAQNPGSLAGAATALVAAHTLAQQPHANPQRWDLHEFIEVAAHLHTIQHETATQARQARNFRNLIHPGRAVRLGQRCDRATAHAALAAVYFVVRDLTPP